MATFYFNAAVDNDWATLGNWWQDNTFTIQANSLPTSSDNVVATASIWSNSGSEPTVANFTINDPNNVGPSLGVGLYPVYLTVTNAATFNSYSSNYATITGNCIFNATSSNYVTVTGNAVFNDSSGNYGLVTGNATFNVSSSNSGTVSVDAVFNDISFNDNYGTVSGNATFNGGSYNNGVTSDAVFNDSSYNGGTVVNMGIFSLSAAAIHIANGYCGTCGSVTFKYEKGINGSSILGIV